MYDFRIAFAYPWLLLLLIPAIALTLLPYFKLAKKYRRNRNRIASIVMHLTAMLLAILTLSGMTFEYKVPNEQNELLLLVDVSESEETAAGTRDKLVETIINDAQFDGYQLGVVTFGYDQQYAVPLSTDVESAFNQYLSAPLPDTSATNVAAAFRYAKDLLQYPQTAKIVLISDGRETDEEALNVIRSVVAQGTVVDVAHIPAKYEDEEVQIVGVKLPEYHVSVDEECAIDVVLKSSVEQSATVELLDNGMQNTETDVQHVVLTGKEQTVSFKHTFTTDELHELTFKVTMQQDGVAQNNAYTTYLYIEEYTNVLIIEHTANTSQALISMFNADNQFTVTPMAISSQDLPMTTDELRAYDQIIMNNIGGADLDTKPGLEEALDEYVRDFGGGLFTLGGMKADGKTANAYNRTDLHGSTYQNMLPVIAEDYTPPIAVMIIIDRSGSMGGEGNETPLEWAKAGAASCLDALTERDYMGIMTLDSSYDMVLKLTPMTQKEDIKMAINSIKTADGGTYPASAIERAGTALLAQNVHKRHIIMVTDGQVPASDRAKSKELVEDFYEQGITFSVVAVNATVGTATYKSMEELTDAGGGKTTAAEGSELVIAMRAELEQDSIKESNEDEPFAPVISDITSPLVKDFVIDTESTTKNQLKVKLGGFYGVKARAAADVILEGPYGVPLYAQWKHGKGTVGSFMCDLNGVWSADFMADEGAQSFVNAVVKNLMPMENIRPKEVEISLSQDNYSNSLSVYTSLDTKNGEYVKGELVCVSQNNMAPLSLNEISAANDAYYVTSSLNAGNNYSRCTFVIKKAGVYKLTLTKYGADGTVIETLETYKAFAYSKEYDVLGNQKVAPLTLMQSIAERGNGSVVKNLLDPWEVFEGFVTELDKSYDPRTVFMIVTIVAFLLDVAVRKFKWKWPHELIREYKAKKEEQERKQRS